MMLQLCSADFTTMLGGTDDIFIVGGCISNYHAR